MYTWTLLLRTPPPHPTPTIYETFAHLYDGKRSDDILNKYIYIYNYIYMHDYAWAMLQMLPHSESHVKNESTMGPVNPQHKHGIRFLPTLW